MTALITKSHSAAASPRAAADDFLDLLPRVRQHATVVFRALPAAEREEAVGEAVAAAFVAFRRLRARGLDPARDFPNQMAIYAVLQVKDDRHVGSRRSSKDVLSRRAQRQHHFRVESLPLSTRRPHEDLYGGIHGQRSLDAYEERLRDNHRTPPPEAAAFRIDFPEFIASLCRRDQRLAGFLSLGNSARNAAARFGLSPGRVTQLRQGWCRHWHVRSGEEMPRLLRLRGKTTSERRDHPGAARNAMTSA
jgi:hypothetical protein